MLNSKDEWSERLSVVHVNTHFQLYKNVIFYFVPLTTLKQYNLDWERSSLYLMIRSGKIEECIDVPNISILLV